MASKTIDMITGKKSYAPDPKPVKAKKTSGSSWLKGGKKNGS